MSLFKKEYWARVNVLAKENIITIVASILLAGAWYKEKVTIASYEEFISTLNSESSMFTIDVSMLATIEYNMNILLWERKHDSNSVTSDNIIRSSYRNRVSQQLKVLYDGYLKSELIDKSRADSLFDTRDSTLVYNDSLWPKEGSGMHTFHKQIAFDMSLQKALADSMLPFQQGRNKLLDLTYHGKEKTITVYYWIYSAGIILITLDRIKSAMKDDKEKNELMNTLNRIEHPRSNSS